MRIGIDVDGVLRDLTGNIANHIKENHPEHKDKILQLWYDTNQK